MTSVFPQSITSADGLGVWPSVLWAASVPTGEVYIPIGHGDDLQTKIDYWGFLVTPENNWVDYGILAPYTIAEETISGVVHIALYESGGLLIRFVKPTVASWISTGPPPNTNSVSDASVSYVVEDNELRIFIPSDKPSSWDPNLNPSGRNLYYQLRKVSGTNFWTRFYHINGFPTNETIVPTTAGIYQLEKVLTNPLDYLTYNTVEVTQAHLDFYATNNPPDDDPPENDPPPTPVFVPRSARRGNLNFW